MLDDAGGDLGQLPSILRRFAVLPDFPQPVAPPAGIGLVALDLVVAGPQADDAVIRGDRPPVLQPVFLGGGAQYLLVNVEVDDDRAELLQAFGCPRPG